MRPNIRLEFARCARRLAKARRLCSRLKRGVGHQEGDEATSDPGSSVWIRSGQTELRTVIELEAELIRRKTRVARVLPADNASFRKVAAALKVLQRQGILIGLIGNVRDDP